VRGWPLALVLSIVLLLGFLTVAGLYASGPEYVYEGRCAPGTEAGNGKCLPGGAVRHKANAWERIKGAVTGEP
jgi:hypothetical protein